MNRKRVIAMRTPIADTALQDFMKHHRLIRRSTKYAIYIDLNRALTVLRDLKEQLSKAKVKEDDLNQILAEKEKQLESMELRLSEAERKTKILEKKEEATEKELNNLKSRLSDTSSKLSEAETRIKDLERQLKEMRQVKNHIPEFGKP